MDLPFVTLQMCAFFILCDFWLNFGSEARHPWVSQAKESLIPDDTAANTCVSVARQQQDEHAVAGMRAVF